MRVKPSLQSDHYVEFYGEGVAVSVVVAEGIRQALDYLTPHGGAPIGAYVEVPFGPRRVLGVIWGKASGEIPQERLRPIRKIIASIPPMPENTRYFLEKAGAYTMTSLPQMLRLATRCPDILNEQSGLRRIIRRSDKVLERTTAQRQKVLEILDEMPESEALTAGELASRAGASPAVVTGLLKLGILNYEAAPADATFMPPRPAFGIHELSTDQKRATEELAQELLPEHHRAVLLEGVTGSGKTEIYFEAAARLLEEGKQVLILLPEIALTAGFLERIQARFGVLPAEWHSGLGNAARRRVWRAAAKGEAQLLVGARSALFLPYANLGLIIVDEEHESSYKQEEGALYNARDMAVLRASIEGIVAILASATPSLESWVNAKKGKYAHVKLESRFGAARLPDMVAVDMRLAGLATNRWISPNLQQATQEALSRGEQALWFLNRRGYAPVTLCRACGHQIECKNCSARMVEHRSKKRLQCHLCGAEENLPKECPSCEAADKMVAIGPGVERLAEEARELFPEARISILSSDRFSTQSALRAEIERIACGAVDLIIGTQLVAKGHNFPRLTLVGVVDADLGLMGSDLRAAERSFQLIHQVAGRAGRAERPGRALIQSWQPLHPVMQAVIGGEMDAFREVEAEARKAMRMPPFGRLAAIILSSKHEKTLMEFASRLAHEARLFDAAGMTLLGPAPAPIYKLRQRYRVRFLIKAERGQALQKIIQKWLERVACPSSVKTQIDIDPQSFF